MTQVSDSLAHESLTRSGESRSILSIVFLVVAGVLLVGLQEKLLGWIAFGLGILSAGLLARDRAKELLLLYFLLAVLGVTPIGTELSNAHVATMGAALVVAILVPSFLDRKYVGETPIVRFRWRMGRSWNAKEWGYLALAIGVGYLLFPYYFRATGAYQNWEVDANAASVFRLFLGTNAVGLWDELAFIVITLGILRRFLPFRWANLCQAILFTSFLYELGFTSWGVLFIFPFALLQGMIFKNTESLAYVVAIHLSLDFVLFLAIINAHHPTWCAVFVT